MSSKPGSQAKFFPAIKSPMLPKGTFQNRIALVTGGGTGLGRAMAIGLSGLGAAVAIMGRYESIFIFFTPFSFIQI